MSEVKEATEQSPQLAVDQERLNQARKPGFGIGLLKGMAVTLKHLFKHNTVIQYPDEKQDLSPRTRGVIALKEENCTVCMLCARECPDWCIYIDSHKETLPPKREGGRQRKRNVLDRFAIDYALCMYCGICVEVCPYDALFWSREFEYAEYDITQLTHEKERLSDWMATVLPPPPLEVGAEQPGAPTASAAQTTTPATGARPATTTSSAAAARPAQAAAAPTEGTAAPTAARPKDSEPGVDAERGARAEARSSSPEQVRQEASAASAPPATTPTEERTGTATPQLAEDVKAEQMSPEATTTAQPVKPTAERPAETEDRPEDSGAGDTAPVAVAPPNVEVPREEPHPVALQPVDDPEAVYRQVLDEQLDKGSSPQVAEARAKVARVKAERGIPRGPTPIEVAKPVPSAPTRAEIASQHQEVASPGQLAGEPTPSGAPRAEEPQPEQGPVAAEPAAAAAAPEARAETTETVGPPPSDDPEAVYERVLREERAKGSSDAVATARAKAARVRAKKRTKGPA